MNASIGDGRVSAWRFKDDVARDIVECAKNLSRAYEILNTNSKTGSRILQGYAVRQNVARNAANVFLDFLFDIAEEKPLDMSGLNPRIVKLVAAKYTREDASWLDLVEPLAETAAESPVARAGSRPAVWEAIPPR